MSQNQVTVEQLIKRMKRGKSFPAISQYITEINSKAAPTGTSSANQLAALILRDYSLTSKLLKVANSVMFGQFSGRIATVSRAVVILGFEQVQTTAASLIFFEHLQDKASSHNIKEAVTSAFLSGMLARDLAKKMRVNGDWENFYIGAMFHNFGRLLAMNYFSDEFTVYQRLLKDDLSEELAERKALGVTFNELGIGVAKAWSLPDQIIVSMEAPQAADLKGDKKRVDHLQLLPRFANELSDISMNVPLKDRQKELVKVMVKYRKVYPLKVKEMIKLLDSAVKEMQKFSGVLRFNSDDIQRLERRSFASSATANNRETAEGSSQQATAALNKFAITDVDPHSQELTAAEERKQHLQDGIQDITNVMLEDFTLDEILGMILETIYRGIGFNRVVIFFKDPQAEQMQARYSLGANAKQIVKNVSFGVDPQAKDLFNMALSDNRDLYIDNIADIEIREYKPEWFKGAIFSPSFAIYPIIINKKEIGIIYGGHEKAGEQLDREQLNSMKTLRNQAALAIKQVFLEK